MIIEFSVSNFRSFKDKQTLSLVAGRDKAHPNALIKVDDNHLLKAAAIYGANASGKSNLIKAMKVMSAFVLGSATKMNQGDQIEGVAPFRLTELTQADPCRFEIKMTVGATQCRYGFCATERRVLSEWLYDEPPTGNRRPLFERTIDSSAGESKWTFGAELKKDEGILKERTRDNGLALSRGAELNIPRLREAFLWFRNNLAVLDLSVNTWDMVRTAAMVARKNEGLNRCLAQLLHDADLGIMGFSVVEKGLPSRAPESGLMKELADRFQSAGMFLHVQTRHQVMDSGKEVEFDLIEEESNGTQRLFGLAGILLSALEAGVVVVVDELECSMHPLLSRKLVEMFQSEELNPKGAQLIFATHDVTLMDPQLLRRDQIWLVEKNAAGASELYSLYDFKEGEEEARPRSTEAFLRRYLAGRYGGVPNFGPAVENLDLK